MNSKIESKSVNALPEVTLKVENPMQEHHFHEVIASVELSAEAVLTARRLEACVEHSDALSPSKGRSAKGEAGPVFVP